MKQLILLLSFLIIVTTQTSSQTFDFNRTSPKIMTYDTAAHMNFVEYHFKLKNTSSTPQNFKLIKIKTLVPSGWEISICCKLGCLASSVDTVPPTGYPDKYTLGPGETDSTVALDFQPILNTTGTAIVILRAFIETNPSNYKQDTCILNIVNTIGITPISTFANEYDLKQNYPNPFNPSTSIEFSLKNNSNVNLIIYDIMGREVARLINNQKLTQGKYKYDFNAGEYNLSSGVYYYKLITGDFTSTKKMLLVK